MAQAKARTWLWLSYMCHIRSTAVTTPRVDRVADSVVSRYLRAEDGKVDSAAKRIKVLLPHPSRVKRRAFGLLARPALRALSGISCGDRALAEPASGR